MKVKCEECGETYTLNDGEDPDDYTCECGGKLTKETELRKLALAVGLISLPFALIGHSEPIWISFGLAAILWFNGKDTSFDDAPRKIKGIAVIAGLYFIGILLIYCYTSAAIVVIPLAIIYYVLSRTLL
ncbi:MAG: hypothetical protein GXW97_00755 [Methanothermobacter sp.]|nr:hypothetical protein [Methanothermobacter sp.]